MQWESVTRTSDEGEVTAVAFTHSGGDTVDSSTLQARAGGSTAETAGTGSDVVAGTVLVVPFDGAGTPLDASGEVHLEWNDPDSSATQTLAQHTLGNETVGSLGEQFRIE